MGEMMKCLTIRQPWAWCIFHAGKRIENRSRRDGRMPPMCRHRGELWIHSGTTRSKRDTNDCAAFMVDRGLCGRRGNVLPYGAIVGRVRVVGVIQPVSHFKPWVQLDDSRIVPDQGAFRDALDLRWWTGGHGLVLADPEPLPEPIPWRKGQQQLWTMPDELAVQVRRALG